MTVLAAAHEGRRGPASAAARHWLEVGGILAALGIIVAGRWFAVTRGVPGLLVGFAFAAALLVVWAASDRSMGQRPSRPVPSRQLPGAAAEGASFGLLLVALSVGGMTIAGVDLPPGISRPSAPFLPWALVIVAVSAAEEGILRGVLFDRVRASGGLVLAIALTTVTFALIHVPLYGWHVVPLDVAVGLGLAGLRLATRTVVGPAVAHAVADLATWWL